MELNRKAMKRNILLAGLLCLLLASCEKEYYTTYPEDDGRVEIDITKYGLPTDGSKDCSALINQIIEDLPPSGGVILLPEGTFLLDKPISISRNFVTIKGVNAGMNGSTDTRSEAEITSAGGGSRLVLRNAASGITVPPVGTVDGMKNRISGIEIKNILIVGNDSYKGTGIHIEGDNDRIRISNVIGTNLEYGIRANASDAIIITNCRMKDVANGIEMSNGIQNMVSDCQLGALPASGACKFTGETNLLFTNNYVSGSLILNGCNKTNLSDNKFTSSYIGMLELKGNNNLMSGNTFFLEGFGMDQLKGYDADYGVIRLSGESNMLASSTLSCEWNPAIKNPVTVNATEGRNSRISGCLIEDQSSDNVLYVNETTVIQDCHVPAGKILLKQEEKIAVKVGYVITYEDASMIEDDDEKASYKWFKGQFTNGEVLTPAGLLSADLSSFDVIWVHIDRVGIGMGWEKLPLPAEAITALADYYKAGGKLFLSNHATQLLIPLGRIGADRAPGIFGDGEGGDGTDVWTINAHIGLLYDHRQNEIYSGMEVSNLYADHESFPMIGPGRREDHNCMWDLNSYGFPDLYPQAGNVVKAFQDENNATVLATWGHVTDFCCAGMVEFKPKDDCLGSCIAIGLAAYEWNQNSGANTYQSNIELLTKNILLYLSKL